MKQMEEKQRKLFLLKLSSVHTKEEVQSYFEKFGEIESVRIVKSDSKKKQKDKIYGFVLFKRRDSLLWVMNIGETHHIQEIEVQCRHSLLKEELKQLKNAEKAALSNNLQCSPHSQQEVSRSRSSATMSRFIISDFWVGNPEKVDLEKNITPDTSLKNTQNFVLGTSIHNSDTSEQGTRFNFSKFATSENSSEYSGIIRNSVLSLFSKDTKQSSNPLENDCPQLQTQLNASTLLSVQSKDLTQLIKLRNGEKAVTQDLTSLKTQLEALEEEETKEKAHSRFTAQNFGLK